MAVKVGVIGLGMMGNTHLDAYSKLGGDAEVVAIADADPKRLSGEDQAAGNFEGLAQGAFDINAVKKYSEGMELVNDPDVELVDVCLPTHMHLMYGKKVLEAGKHLLMEKPLARTYSDAKQLADAADASNNISMCAMCMRFWPGWTWLTDAADNKTYGKVLGATFRRVSSHPGGAFYENGEKCGGAALDLHIHDADFVQYLFGMPKAVTSVGYSKISGATDHLTTQYHFDDVPLVTAEGGWALAAGFPFTMTYAVNFEQATAQFSITGDPQLTLIQNGEAQAVELPGGMGYDHEIKYLIDCINAGKQPQTVTMQDAANAVRLVEAEVESIATGKSVSL